MAWPWQEERLLLEMECAKLVGDQVQAPKAKTLELCSCATHMLLKIFRRQGDEYFVSDIVVGFAEEET